MKASVSILSFVVFCALSSAAAQLVFSNLANMANESARASILLVDGPGSGAQGNGSIVING
jgi:hypothetical protein